ncbi:MAG: crossover junction endodeoxyribonuclease RuvC [Proteobacteria bacterium]|nr:crossover junction endodeoxyribonuclease RuvC [Pseudomonadota bacterium]
MRVLGIDPGSNVTGYGIVEGRGISLTHIDNGIIAPKADLPLPQRLLCIHSELVSLIGRHSPDAVAIENVFVAKNVRSSLMLGHARGVAMLAACQAGLDAAEYTPSQVKGAVTGSGRADKGQVQRMVRALLGLPEVAAEDASDALAVAMCHLNSAGLAERIARAKG